MKNIIYVKKVNDYDDIIKKRRNIPIILKKIIYLFKNILNIITIKKENLKVCVLPMKEKISSKKLNLLIKKIGKDINISNNKFVISNDLIKENVLTIFDQYHLSYFNGEKIKKIFVFKILEYINNLQYKEKNTRNITILCNENSPIHQFIITRLAMEYKTIKIVSKKIYQFKKLEEILYNENGVAIQFSNSYQKSLLKSELILNLDFNDIQINEYVINSKAIIINVQEKIKIKSKLFNGIIINSCRIKFSDDLKKMFSKEKLLHRYDMLMLYESIVDWEKHDYESIIEDMEDDKVNILNLIGNNGIISKKEFKIVK